MTDETPIYEDTAGQAPLVYFDLAAAHGTLSGVIQIEVAGRVLIPSLQSGAVRSKYITSGRLRCSPAAAISLRDALNAALKMLEEPLQDSVAATKMN